MGKPTICIECRFGIAPDDLRFCAACVYKNLVAEGEPSKAKTERRRIRKAAEPYGECPICRKILVLKVDRHLRPHKNAKTGKHCLGSGGPPRQNSQPVRAGAASTSSARVVSGGLPTLGKRRG